MERYAEIEKSRLLNVKARCNESSVPKVLTFVDESGDPFDITGKNWIIQVKKIPGASSDVITLTEDDGITVSDTNKLTFTVSKERATVRADVYFWVLRSLEEDKTWVNGDWEFHNGKYDGVTETDTLTIYENGGTVTITITGSESHISVLTQASTATLTPSPTYDAFNLTAQAEALVIANPSTSYADFEPFAIRIKDDGTARAISFGNKYRAQGVALPTTTTISKVMIIVCIYDSVGDKYDVKYSEEV